MRRWRACSLHVACLPMGLLRYRRCQPDIQMVLTLLYPTLPTRCPKWKVVGELRRLDAEANTDWKVQRFWQNEVARVMPDFQKPESRAKNWGFKSFLPGGGAVSDEDYELLGLPTTPLPTSVEVRKAFRMQAMAWHPDLQQLKSAAEQAECAERFQRIGEAYKRLQARHPEYLDQQATRSRS